MKEKFSKQEIERAYAEKFLKYYNQYLSTQISLSWNGRQDSINEPDIVCSDWVYIEIVSSSYGTKITEAEKCVEKWKLKKVGDLFKKGFEVKNTDILVWEKTVSLLWLSIEEPDKKAFCFIRERINDKFSKKYDFTEAKAKFILLITVSTALTTQDDFKKHFSQYPIILDKNNIFDEVWYFQGRHYSSKKDDVFDGLVEIWDGDYSVFQIS